MRGDNAPRFQPQRPGVESWFVRANHPTEPRALWLKATVFVPKQGVALAEVWCTVFDGERRKTWAAKRTVPLDEASFGGDGPAIYIDGCRFGLGPDGGQATGSVDALSWDLSWTGTPGPLGRPLCLIPRRLVAAPFPRTKLLTPLPSLGVEGRLMVGAEVWDLAGWTGSQGHNWGTSHPPEYAWGQVVFPGADGAPSVTAEGFTGRVWLGPVLSPRVSALTIRRGEQVFAFDRLVDLWSQHQDIGDLSWSLRMRGPAGEAMLSMRADAELTVCLGYANPAGPTSLCVNSKLARAVLRVNPAQGEAFELTSPHGAALELLSFTPDARFTPI